MKIHRNSSRTTGYVEQPSELHRLPGSNSTQTSQRQAIFELKGHTEMLSTPGCNLSSKWEERGGWGCCCSISIL